jgi:hypothetical protein
LTTAGVLLGIFPLEQTSKSVRSGVAVVLILVAVLSGILSAFQAHAQDAEIAALSSEEKMGINNVRGDISSLKAQTPRIPRLQVHSAGQVFVQALSNGPPYRTHSSY